MTAPNLTPARLAALREAERRATGAPWIVFVGQGAFAAGPDSSGPADNRDDAAFICEMRNELPALLTALETRTALLREAREALGLRGMEVGPDGISLRAKIDAELGGGT